MTTPTPTPTTPSRADRPAIVGPDAGPEPPFPLRLEGEIVKGFGRGSKELGIPTANIPVGGLAVGGRTDVASGIYFGWAGLRAPAGVHRSSPSDDSSNPVATEDRRGVSYAPSTSKDDADRVVVYPMVMSVGWNPFYKNTQRSVEIHLIHDFATDFYGAHIRLAILGFVRPELDYVSRDALVADIRTDIRVTRASLARAAWATYKEERWLVGEGEGSE